jgi:hypothetical protein
MANRKVGPSLDLMRAASLAGLPIDGAAESDGGSNGIELVQQVFNTKLNLLANTGSAAPGIDGKATTLQNFGLSITGDHLQLGAAGFNSEECFAFHSRFWRRRCEESAEVVGLISGLPFDIAAYRRFLIGRDRFFGQQRVERAAQLLTARRD